MQTNHAFKIGIDAGRHTGLAIMNNQTGKLVEIYTLTFWSAHDLIVESGKYTPENTRLVVEFLGSGALYARTAANTQRGRDRFAANVGGVRKETELLIERLESKGFEVRKIRPIREPKWSPEQFARITGFLCRTSEHSRDAARLLYFG